MKFLELTNDGPILVFKSGDTGSYSYGNPYDLDTMTSSFKIKFISIYQVRVVLVFDNRLVVLLIYRVSKQSMCFENIDISDKPKYQWR